MTDLLHCRSVLLFTMKLILYRSIEKTDKHVLHLVEKTDKIIYFFIEKVDKMRKATNLLLNYQNFNTVEKLRSH